MGALFLKSFWPRISVQVVSYHREKSVVLKARGVDSKTTVSGSQLCQLVGKLFKCWDSVFSSVKQELWEDLRHMVELCAVTSTEKYLANTTIIIAITDSCHLREPERVNFFKIGKNIEKISCISLIVYQLISFLSTIGKGKKKTENCLHKVSQLCYSSSLGVVCSRQK